MAPSEGKIPIDNLDIVGLRLLIEYATRRLSQLQSECNIPPTNIPAQTQRDTDTPSNGNVDDQMDQDNQNTDYNMTPNPDGFSIPKKTKFAKKRTYTQLDNPTTSTQNRFTTLEDDPDNQPEADPAPNPENTTPIILREKEKWTQVSKLLLSKKIAYKPPVQKTASEFNRKL
ncbi:hypothetical protein TcasGA2_TC033480 [Tribolium castaneum]|uniref:Uncharacterized protein n=1 Tax=Tribolium castaneum TaxID=7070 RepID=A0A139WG75_TRICA|nr:hypothetical protein TcasGA2_TC033480 [Tribolium castaneum]